MKFNPNAPDAPRLLSIEEAAARLCLHPETVRSFLRQGKISGFKIGKTWRLTPDALSAYIADRAAESNNGAAVPQ